MIMMSTIIEKKSIIERETIIVTIIEKKTIVVMIFLETVVEVKGRKETGAQQEKETMEIMKTAKISKEKL